MIGGHYLRSWSRTQQSVSTSSAEAELIAMNKAASELLGCMSMYTDFGEDDGRCSRRSGSGAVTISGVLCGDSSAALAIANRQGLSKLKHIRLGELWIQEKIREKELTVQKVSGESNVADLFTKHLLEAKMEQHCEFLNCQRRSGRAQSGLGVQTGLRQGEARAV